jgi:hypothetical protein
MHVPIIPLIKKPVNARFLGFIDNLFLNAFFSKLKV